MYPPMDCWGLACVEWKLAKQPPNSVEQCRTKLRLSSALYQMGARQKDHRRSTMEHLEVNGRRTAEGQPWNSWTHRRSTMENVEVNGRRTAERRRREERRRRRTTAHYDRAATRSRNCCCDDCSEIVQNSRGMDE